MTMREGGLFADIPGRPDAEMVPAAADEFLLLTTRQRVVFDRAGDGTLRGVRSPVRLTRTSDAG